MRYIEVAGEKLSVIGLGTWQFGSIEWGYGSDYLKEEAPKIIDAAVESGINVIDTAEIYGMGRSERAVGRAIKDIRDKVFVATKLAPVAPVPPIVQLRARLSARRLGIDTIDLYQLHWPNLIVPLRLTMQGIRSLLDSGAIRLAGVSNYSLDRWREADEALGRPVFSNQVEFSLVQRKPLEGLVNFARANDRVILAYSPLAKGFLSCKYSKDELPSNAVRRANYLFRPENLEKAAPLLSLLREISKKYDAEPSQIALAWLVKKPNTIAIPGASSVDQVKKNAEAADIELSDDDEEALLEAAEAFEPVKPAQRFGIRR
jgi:aryl-alcohol dehydrogenase-like predicted oxidoreductase